MDKKNLKKLFTMQSIISFATSSTWSTVTAMVAAFSNGITSLTTVVNQITAILGPQSASVAGGGALKDYYRSILDRMSFAIMNATRGYLLSINDFDTAKQLDKSLTEINRVSDKAIASEASNWLNIVNSFITNLGPWGITATNITDWQSAITNYQNVYELPKNKFETKKLLTTQERQLIKQGMAIVKSTLDTAITSFIALSQQDFVTAYKGYRRIGEVAGLHHTRLNALVVDELGQPFFGVIVTVNEIIKNGKTYHSVSATTDINGFCTPEKFEPGAREVTISGPGIVEKKFGPFYFHNGKAFNQIFTMEPDFANLPVSQPTEEKEKENK